MSVTRVDAAFANPRLAEVYDVVDGERRDLDVYTGIVAEFGARSVLDVAQVFLRDQDWAAALRAIHAALRPGGRLVFETRDPARKAWLEWNRARVLSPLPGPGRWRGHVVGRPDGSLRGRRVVPVDL
jgi:hypothetical protein